MARPLFSHRFHSTDYVNKSEYRAKVSSVDLCMNISFIEWLTEIQFICLNWIKLRYENMKLSVKDIEMCQSNDNILTIKKFA